MVVRYFTDFGLAILLAVPTLAMARPQTPVPQQMEAEDAPAILVARAAYEDRYFRMRQSPFT